MPEGTDEGLGARISRRELVKRAGVGAGGLMLAGTAVPRGFAITRVSASPRVSAADTTIKIGFVSPLTGAVSDLVSPIHT